MSDELKQHELTENFFDLLLYFALEMRGKDSPDLFYQGQGNILYALSERDGQSQKELAEGLSISAPSVTEFVNKLVKKGLVQKNHSKKDKRVTLINLTAAGKQVISEGHQSEISGWNLLSDADQDKLAKLFQTIIAGMAAKYNGPNDKQRLASMRQSFLAMVTKGKEK
ncbi:MarR family transcriptional regulator [Lentilactobacillus otakiensis]|uniref:Transcriptional regulator, MarR family n=1 Tax=Lentilactobacillus otakiensis DSM 19908 = JCM 15040 TaxID=1423780 RepID=S4NRI9_9LACO|nr:MarR family transcriptional regulator [Lentilactobacillus otakiensis]KRL09846.1 transcriptional regulator, MarR family [Lentilactobacillus otakiensis DSM 19908 = JCM 15040]MBZ3776194.1 MarR family transcriptional regulator [Lentilactobacillus otakiensis]MDV3517197.1 MarR family transcriptional regulator [Lentilactobacillus otakiensis]GAD16563.1 transcriptional regulator, MarR family [Lentilactobacillus otakiensis DSM 19908 = JCM 15040]